MEQHVGSAAASQSYILHSHVVCGKGRDFEIPLFSSFDARPRLEVLVLVRPVRQCCHE